MTDLLAGVGARPAHHAVAWGDPSRQDRDRAGIQPGAVWHHRRLFGGPWCDFPQLTGKIFQLFDASFVGFRLKDREIVASTGIAPSTSKSLRPLIEGTDTAEQIIFSFWDSDVSPGFMAFDGRFKLMIGRKEKTNGFRDTDVCGIDPHHSTHSGHDLSSKFSFTPFGSIMTRTIVME